MRTAPLGQRQDCYDEAHESVRAKDSFDEFNGACDSALALKGDSAPALTVILNPQEQLQEQDSIGQKPERVSCCQVTLLSGASFACDFLACSPNVDQHIVSTPNTDDVEQEATHKRPRLAPENPEPQQPQPPTTVAQLAAAVLAELPKHVEVYPVPERAFFVFAKQGDSSDDAVPLTPWHWNRPLIDFL